MTPEMALSFLGYLVRIHKIMQGFSTPAAPIVETVVPNPRLKLLDQVPKQLRAGQPALNLQPSTDLRPGGAGTKSPLDCL